nr:MAG TPA: hypothetical protein [Caudoviricetes sp.]
MIRALLLCPKSSKITHNVILQQNQDACERAR